jgi:hypothetical protein
MGKGTREAASGLAKLGQFAAGAVFGDGTANAGTSKSIGDRIKSGFAAASPNFQATQRIGSRIQANKAQANRMNSSAQQQQLEDEKDNTPVDLDQLLGHKIPEQFKQKIMELARIHNADVDGNGITTMAEITKVMPQMTEELSDIMEESIKSRKAGFAVLDAAVSKEFEKIAPAMKNFMLSEDDVLNNPEQLGQFKSLQAAVMQKQRAKADLRDLAQISTQLKNRVRSQQTKTERVTSDPKFQQNMNTLISELSNPTEASDGRSPQELIQAMIFEYGDAENAILKRLRSLGFLKGLGKGPDNVDNLQK